MKYFFIFLFFLSNCLYIFTQQSQTIDLNYEYSLDEFQRGIRSLHNCQYELAIYHFTKSLTYNEQNNLSKFYLGESYRKAGFEKNALFIWNSLLATGYNAKYLKSKISYLYNKKGMVNEIFIDKGYLLKEDIKGYFDEKTPPLFLKPSQISVDSNNHYYIASFLTGNISEFDSNLNHLRNYFSAYPKIEKPYGIALDKYGYIYVSDFAKDVIYKMNKFNVVEKTIGFKGISQGALLGPKNLLIDDEDMLYVSDSGNKRINKYNLDGKFILSFGNNENNIKLTSPAGLFLYNNNIYVCDRDSNQIFIFDKSGNYLNSLTSQYLSKPYDITIDKLGRLLIICEKELWAYEIENSLWYQIDALGSRVGKCLSIIKDLDNNILITDFNNSRLYVLTPERERYSNFNINIERVYTQKYPHIHLAIKIEKNDFSTPAGIDASNIFLYENGKLIRNKGTIHTETKNNKSDIVILFDRNNNMTKYYSDIEKLFDIWIKSIKKQTNIALISIKNSDTVVENHFNSTRLSYIDSIYNKYNNIYTDKGMGIKNAINYMINRFSKKSVIILTDGTETGKDFDKFNIEDAVTFAQNNDISIYVVAFGEGPLTKIYKYIAQKTNGDYLRIYKRSDLKDLINIIEDKKGKEIIISYVSRTISRFREEPISVYIEINYRGMKGITETIYYPPKY